MKINADQLVGSLKRGLKPVYVVAGDEALLVEESRVAILAKAKSTGFSERNLIEVGTGFDWASFSYDAIAPSLFADKRILDCRLTSLKIGDAGSKAFRAFAENPPPDTLLLISAPKLDASAQKSKWITLLGNSGVIVTVWPIDLANFGAWVRERLQRAGLLATPSLIQCLCMHTEGNLLAVRGQIEKLSLLGTTDEATLKEAITDAAHYSVFDLTSSALLGNTGRAINILRHLEAEKTEAPLVLWTLTQALRQSAYLIMHQGQKPFATLCREKGIWQKRSQEFASYLKRHSQKSVHTQLRLASDVDYTIKGALPGNPWTLLERLVLRMVGLNLQEHKAYV